MADKTEGTYYTSEPHPNDTIISFTEPIQFKSGSSFSLPSFETVFGDNPNETTLTVSAQVRHRTTKYGRNRITESMHLHFHKFYTMIVPHVAQLF